MSVAHHWGFCVAHIPHHTQIHTHDFAELTFLIGSTARGNYTDSSLHALSLH